jgi:hypothetical protein
MMTARTLGVFVLALLAGMVGEARATFIVNGGFESDLSNGWSSSNVLRVSNSVHSGSNSAAFLVGANDSLSQTVTGISGPGTFTLDFFLSSYFDSNPQEFKVLFDGVTVLDQTSFPSTVTFQPCSLTFTLPSLSSTPVLTFQVKAASIMRIDDISLTQAPTAVPLPSALVLVLTGLPGYFGLCRWSRGRDAAADRSI